VTVENAIEICRSPEDVFDYLTGITKEAEWNPRTRRVEKLAPGPIGLGTRFGAEWIKGNPAVAGCVRFERPAARAAIARSRRLDAKGEGRIPPAEQGSRVMVRTRLRPKGLLALLLPLMRRTVHEREDQNQDRSRRSWRARGDDHRACPRGPPRPGVSREREAAVATYREDMRRAWERINSFHTQRLETRFGTIEYADRGEGVPLVVSHGVLGCHVDTVDGWWAGLPGPGFRVIGPLVVLLKAFNRLGYFPCWTRCRRGAVQLHRQGHRAPRRQPAGWAEQPMASIERTDWTAAITALDSCVAYGGEQVA
jgi:hypothetical protein